MVAVYPLMVFFDKPILFSWRGGGGVGVVFVTRGIVVYYHRREMNE